MHDVEQALDLQVGEHGGGLVENDEVGAAEQDLHDLDALLHADGHVADLLVKVDLHAVAVHEFLDRLAIVSDLEQRAVVALVAQDDVLEARHVLDEHEVLVDHADAVLDGHARAGDVHLLAANVDLALCGRVEPDEDVHERGLASAVLAQKRVDLALLDREVHVLVSVERTEALADVLHPQQLGHTYHLSMFPACTALAVPSPLLPVRSSGLDRCLCRTSQNSQTQRSFPLVAPPRGGGAGISVPRVTRHADGLVNCLVRKSYYKLAGRLTFFQFPPLIRPVLPGGRLTVLRSHFLK